MHTLDVFAHRPKTLMEMTVYEAFFVTGFQHSGASFSPIHSRNGTFTKTLRFRNHFKSLRFHQCLILVALV